MIGRRFKLYLPLMTEELLWEIEVLEMLEQDVYPYLQAQGIPSELWEYYVAFAKRMWERRVHFDYETFQLEKTSLLNEFTLRDLNPTHLDAIQDFAETRAVQKITREAWTRCWSEGWGYSTGEYYKCWGEIWGYGPPPEESMCWTEAWSS